MPYFLFILLRELSLATHFPDRDQLSAYTHLIAFAIFAYRYMRLGDYRKNWIYLPALIFVFIMFLEESEFLSEISFFGRNFYFQHQPQFVMPYLEKYGLQELRWRSFHNFFYFIFTKWWAEYFNVKLLTIMMSRNLWAIGTSFLFVIMQRPPLTFLTINIRKSKHILLTWALLGGLGIFWLLLFNVISSQIDAWIKGLFIMVSVFPLGTSFFFIRREFSLFNSDKIIQGIKESPRNRTALLGTLLGIGILLVGLQVSLTNFGIGLSTEAKSLFISTIALLLGQIGLLGFVIIGLNDFFSRPLRSYWIQFRNFLLRRPAFFYLGSYITIMGFAQLIDWKIIDRTGIRLLREEVVEWAAAFQLVLVGLAIKVNNKRGK